MPRELTSDEYNAVWAGLRLLGEALEKGDLSGDIDLIRTCGGEYPGLDAEACQALADDLADFATMKLD
ncbi:hypothetical protein [Sphingomonas sp. 3-13AW]|uniref:hypothetical protein n=1 Tax=Sphingomonas sp. 3-13AW TaxID=3050450 RepID=UPI003BB53341